MNEQGRLEERPEEKAGGRRKRKPDEHFPPGWNGYYRTIWDGPKEPPDENVPPGWIGYYRTIWDGPKEPGE